MTYMEQFTESQVRQAFEEMRPDFREKLFAGGLEQARGFALAAANLIYPGTDCFAEHFRTCFEFYITYAFARLMGRSQEQAAAECETKYGVLPPMIFQAVLELCGDCLHQSFPSLGQGQ